MMSLDVDEASDLLESAEHVELVRIHGRIAGPEGEVGIYLLEPIEGGVKDGEAAFQHGAVSEVLNVTGVNCVGELANLGARSVTGNTFSFLGLKIFRKMLKLLNNNLSP